MRAQLPLSQEEVGGGDVVVVVPVQAVDDEVPAGDLATHHLLDDVGVVLLRQVLPADQGEGRGRVRGGGVGQPGVHTDLEKREPL